MCVCVCVCMLSCFSHLWLLDTLWIIACQAPLSMGILEAKTLKLVACPPPGNLPDPEIQPASPRSTALAGSICIRRMRYILSSVQSLSCVQLFATPWSAAHQASLSITNSQSLLKLMSIDFVISSNHLILCHPLLLSPSICPSIRVFFSESVLCIRWPKYWSFNFCIRNILSDLLVYIK